MSRSFVWRATGLPDEPSVCVMRCSFVWRAARSQRGEASKEMRTLSPVADGLQCGGERSAEYCGPYSATPLHGSWLHDQSTREFFQPIAAAVTALYLDGLLQRTLIGN